MAHLVWHQAVGLLIGANVLTQSINEPERYYFIPCPDLSLLTPKLERFTEQEIEESLSLIFEVIP